LTVLDTFGRAMGVGNPFDRAISAEDAPDYLQVLHNEASQTGYPHTLGADCLSHHLPAKPNHEGLE